MVEEATQESVNGIAEETPQALHPPSFTLELQIDRSWKPMQVLGARWDEKGKHFLLDATYRNDTGQAQLCEGHSRLLFCGREVLVFPTAAAPFVIPPGMGLSDRWPLTM